MFIKCSVKFGGDKAPFDASLRKNGISRKSFGFRKHEINVQLFSNLVFGVGRTLV